MVKPFLGFLTISEESKSPSGLLVYSVASFKHPTGLLGDFRREFDSSGAAESGELSLDLAGLASK